MTETPGEVTQEVTQEVAQEVARHYGRGGLLERLLGALSEAGKDIAHLTIDDLSPVDDSTRAGGRRRWNFPVIGAGGRATT